MSRKSWKRVAAISVAVGVVLICFVVFVMLLDFDGDGLNNMDELSFGTIIFNPDTDGDELDDGLEVKTYKTNPSSFDSDGDGLGDGTEVLGSWHVLELTQTPWVENDYGLNWILEHRIWDRTDFQTYRSWQGSSWGWPYDYENLFVDNGLFQMTSDPLSANTDGDGLNDYTEYEIGTDPRSEDTDNDGFEDRMESTASKTIPMFYDTDGDLLGDWEEIDKYSTDPLIWDIDGDHLSDGVEVKGYDVNDDGVVDVDFPAFGANPRVRDIFVEVDWMSGAKMLGSYSLGKLVEAFAEHGMALHIDQGELGGGSETDERVEILYDNRAGRMNDFFDFEKKYFTDSRWGVFFWCLITTSATYSGQVEVGGFNYGDGFTVAGTWRSDSDLGSAFMHELGHALGLDNDLFDGVDSEKYSFDEYLSVMNYNAPYITGGEFFNYSEGAPFDDWAHLGFRSLSGRHPKATEP